MIWRYQESSITVLRWLKRYMAKGIEALKDAPRPGRNLTVTEAYRQKLMKAVRRRPRSLGLEYSMWTLRRVADYLAEETGLQVSHETVRRELAKEDIVFTMLMSSMSVGCLPYELCGVRKVRLNPLGDYLCWG